MSRVASTKLFAFLVFLPEFFTTVPVEKVKLTCLPDELCEREGGEMKDEDMERHRWKKVCDFNQTSGGENWLQACVQQVGHTESDSGKNTDMRRFVCNTDGITDELQRSSSASEYLEVSVDVQLRDGHLNLTLYGGNNQSSLRLHFPDKEEEDDEDLLEAFYCCVLSGEAPHKPCLFWISNNTLFRASGKQETREEEDDWHCVFRALWLVLLCVLVLAIVSHVLGQIYKTEQRGQKLKELPGAHTLAAMLLKEKENCTSIQAPNGSVPHTWGSHGPGSGLSPIQEVDTKDEIETLLNGGNFTEGSAANLHHRSHSSSSTSGDTEEQIC